nr:hypothetical protein Iba_scaffold1680035CG0010 [Ipomoea batatas]
MTKKRKGSYLGNKHPQCCETFYTNCGTASKLSSSLNICSLYANSKISSESGILNTLSRSDSQCPTAAEAVSDWRNASKHSSCFKSHFEKGGSCKLSTSKSKGQELIFLHGHESSEQGRRFSSSALKHLITPSRNSSEASRGESNAPRVNFFSSTTNCKNARWHFFRSSSRQFNTPSPKMSPTLSGVSGKLDIIDLPLESSFGVDLQSTAASSRSSNGNNAPTRRRAGGLHEEIGEEAEGVEILQSCRFFFAAGNEIDVIVAFFDTLHCNSIEATLAAAVKLRIASTSRRTSEVEGPGRLELWECGG